MIVPCFCMLLSRVEPPKDFLQYSSQVYIFLSQLWLKKAITVKFDGAKIRYVWFLRQVSGHWGLAKKTVIKWEWLELTCSPIDKTFQLVNNLITRLKLKSHSSQYCFFFFLYHASRFLKLIICFFLGCLWKGDKSKGLKDYWGSNHWFTLFPFQLLAASKNNNNKK